MFKKDIVNAVQAQFPDFSKRQIFEVVTSTVNTVGDFLCAGTAVNINDLGTFKPKTIPAKKGAKLPDGRLVDLPEKKTARFVPSSKIFREEEAAASAPAAK
jgi:nucleoid DNA-binding protein